ncbi:MAG: hypothetical protein JM58_01660 [Peptococcaceae bacterium BICA1-8]|nr:MAG: hypothetical protein JM58_01660 [Peptococcaceae bacterium BICA1-8]
MKFVDGYKVITIPAEAQKEEEKALLLEGEQITIIPINKDLKKIYLEVTNDCNFDCITCIRHSWKEEMGYISDAAIEALLNSLSDFSQLKTVHIGGFGEPLSHPNILSIIEKFKNKGLRVEMITNGSLLSQNMIKDLITLGLDAIYVSIDGSDAKNYNEIRKGGNYNQIINNIQELNRQSGNSYPLKPELGVEFVAMKSNYKDLPNLMRLADYLKARKVLITNVLPYHESMIKEVLYDLEYKNSLFDSKSCHSYMANMKLNTYRNCKFVEDNSVSITWQGEVAPCYALMHSYKCYIYEREKTVSSHSFGNINKEKLLDIWQSPQYVNFRYRVKEKKIPSCTDCQWLDGCSYTQDNEADCWGNEPSCADCLWYREMIICP